MRSSAHYLRHSLAAAIYLALAPMAFAATPEVSAERESITVGSEAPAYTLRLSYPDGRTSERVLLSGETFAIDAASPGGLLADGVYQFDAQPITGMRQRSDDQLDPEADKSSEFNLPTESGTFRVHEGRIVVANAEPNKQGDQDFGVRMKDQFFADDIVATGSACIGFDCVNGENFGFDTIRVKENNLRIHFQDTSNSGSFPSNDWRLVANDTSNGGANYFAIEDSDTSRRVFEVRAGAPANSLFVDSSGRVGIKTSTPVVNIHVAEGNTPALRLEQNGSSGFTAQTWDIAGNETNFFVRDVTNGSRLPFRIQPGAPSSSLFIDSTGDIGLGGTPQDLGAFRNLSIRSGGSGSSYEHTDSAGTRRAFWVYNGDSNTTSFGTMPGAGPLLLRPELDAGMVAIGTVSPTAKLDVNGDTIRLRTARVPASSSSPCNQGDLAWGPDFIYVCVATNTWKRSSLSSW